MRRAGWAAFGVLAALGIGVAATWDRPWAEDLRCDLGGGVPIGARCYEPDRDFVRVLEGDLEPDEMDRLIRFTAIDTLFVEPPVVREGFGAFPALPDLTGLRVSPLSDAGEWPVRLDGIGSLGPLETVNIQNAVVSDMSPLAAVDPVTVLLTGSEVADMPGALPRLQGIGLRSTRIDALDFVAGAPNLRWLSLSHETLPDLAPLASAPQLFELSIGTASDEGLADLSPLAGLSELSSLWLSGGGLEDLSPLSDLPALTTLALGGAQGLDLAPVAALPALTDLSLFRAEGTPFGPLTDAPVLTKLRLVASGDVERLSVSTLEELDVQGTPRLILSRAGPMPALRIIRLEDVGLVRLAGMPKMPSLTLLAIDDAGSVDLTELAAAAPRLEWLDLRGVPDLDLSAIDGLATLEILVATLAPATPPDLSTLPALRQLSLSGVPLDVLIPLRGGPIERLHLDDIDWGEEAVPVAALLPLPELRTLQIGRGVVDAETLARLPLLETVRARDPDGGRVSLSGRDEVEAWIEENL